MRRLLIDGNHLTGRCWATMKDLTTKQGFRSGAVLGFLKGLSWIRHEVRVDFPEVIVCWDYGRCARRMELYPEYKGNRSPDDPTPEELMLKEQYIKQLIALQSVLPLVGVRQVCIKGVEADDLIGIYANMYSKGGEVTIYSGDHDMHQLVTERIRIFDARKGILGLPEVLDLWKVEFTEMIPIYKAIVGDSSDNIKGVKGLGDKRTQALLKSLEVFIPWKEIRFDTDASQNGTRKWIDKVFDDSDIVFRNWELMKIPITWQEAINRKLYTFEQACASVESLQVVHDPSLEKFVEFCKEWELHSVLENLNGW